jgi:predicted nucleic acid-binding protein
MEQRYLIDTNVIIDAQIGKIPKAGMDFLTNVLNTSFNVSFVSYIEFMGYKDIKPQSEVFISMATIIEINKSIIDACIVLRKVKRIKLPDAIIAATAICNNLIIVSRNTKDFANIENLQCIDPYNL